MTTKRTSLPARPAAPRTRPAKKTPTPPKGDVREQTLDEFDAQLTEHFGGEVGFADTVRNLAAVRARRAAMEKARKAAFEQIKAAYEGGARVAAGFELRQTRRGEPEVYRAPDSAEVKSKAPAAWTAAQTLVRRVSVTPPKTGFTVALDPLPPKLKATATADQVVSFYKSPLFDVLKDLKVEEADLVGTLEKIAANAGWDGEEITFADGWRAGLARRQFSAERLREVDPDTWERFAKTKVRENAPRVYLATAGGDDDGSVDLDGE